MTQYPAFIDLSSLNGTSGFAIPGVAAGDYAGNSVATAGDVNGDGFADIIVGAFHNATGAGASYVVFGKASAFSSSLDLTTLNGTNGFKIAGVAANDYSGFSVSSAGDVNGDGFDDMIVGAKLADPHGGASGATYVVFGKGSGFGATLNLSTLNGANGFELSGTTAGGNSGVSVSSAGDVNGDGYADVIVGAFHEGPHGANSGAAYVVFGKASGFTANIDLSALTGANGFKLSGVAASDVSAERSMLAVKPEALPNTT